MFQVMGMASSHYTVKTCCPTPILMLHKVLMGINIEMNFGVSVIQYFHDLHGKF